eukprot:TRINITY_DN7142_c0_g1_i2.p1 TRINITY_DN7142_c0_g1~~TRINITY_DN7142_c0_g1_i2.p1  ORF type:complete len:880 (-),score=90.07 TRINITY_DN7142_c0_g1_i2:883-3522(-)
MRCLNSIYPHTCVLKLTSIRQVSQTASSLTQFRQGATRRCVQSTTSEPSQRHRRRRGCWRPLLIWETFTWRPMTSYRSHHFAFPTRQKEAGPVEFPELSKSSAGQPGGTSPPLAPPTAGNEGAISASTPYWAPEASNGPQPIRIVPMFAWETASSPAADFLQRRVVPSMLRYVSSLIAVRHPVVGPLRITPVCSLADVKGNCLAWSSSCEDLGAISPSLLTAYTTCNSSSSSGTIGATECRTSSEGAGVPNADYILYFTSQDSYLCISQASTIAHSQHCFQEAEWDRPIAGLVNVCPAFLSSSDALNFSTATSLLVHEVIHALVFSPALFPFFRTATGEPLVSRGAALVPGQISPVVGNESAVVQSVALDGWQFLQVVTPQVVQMVRRHFNCSSMAGGLLEDAGSSGQLNRHWSARWFQGELMTSKAVIFPILSNVTLALFEDSGWYVPDYSRGGFLRFGFEKGCAFADELCHDATAGTVFSGSFCATGASSGCSPDALAMGFCQSCNELSDPASRCGVSNCSSVEMYLDQHCQWPQDERPEWATWGQAFGLNSRCFSDGGSVWAKGGLLRQAGLGGGCFPQHCDWSPNGSVALRVQVGDALVSCSDSEPVELRGRGSWQGGVFACPLPADFCRFSGCPSDCNARGACFAGTCSCFPAFAGSACEQPICASDADCPNSTCSAVTGGCQPSAAALAHNSSALPFLPPAPIAPKGHDVSWLLGDIRFCGVAVPGWALLSASLAFFLVLLVAIALIIRRCRNSPARLHRLKAEMKHGRQIVTSPRATPPGPSPLLGSLPPASPELLSPRAQPTEDLTPSPPPVTMKTSRIGPWQWPHLSDLFASHPACSLGCSPSREHLISMWREESCPSPVAMQSFESPET